MIKSDVYLLQINNKDIKRMESQNLKHISPQIIRNIAFNANCSREYVRLIVAGERDAKSIKAKAILKASKKINRKVETALNEAKKELILIGEND